MNLLMIMMNLQNNNNAVENVKSIQQEEHPKKQKLKNIDAVLDESKYLTNQQKRTFKYSDAFGDKMTNVLGQKNFFTKWCCKYYETCSWLSRCDKDCQNTT